MSIAALVIVCLFLAVCIVIRVHNFLINKAIDSYISKTARDPKTGIMKGAESIYLPNKSKKAALLIHGFIGSPSDFGRLPALLNELGLTVVVPLLPGHGTSPREFSKTTPEELETFVTDAYRRLKSEFEEVVLIGFSMGGSLSILTAAQEKVDSLVLLAPYLSIAHQWYYIFPTELYNRVFQNFIPYVYRPEHFKQINKKEAASSIVDYEFVPLKGAATAIQLGKKAVRKVSSLKQPALIIHALGDCATDCRMSKQLSEKLRPSSFVTLAKSNHMILWDYDAEKVEAEVLRFVGHAVCA